MKKSKITKKNKKTIWDNIIIINSVLLVALLLVNVFVIFLPKLKNSNSVLLHYNYEVEFCSYVVNGENKQLVSRDKFLFIDKNIENNSAESKLNVAVGGGDYVRIEYRIANKTDDVPLKAILNFNSLTIQNCSLEYSFSEDYSELDQEWLDLRVEPDSKNICRIKISIDDYSQDALCEGKFKVVLSIAKGE